MAWLHPTVVMSYRLLGNSVLQMYSGNQGYTSQSLCLHTPQVGPKRQTPICTVDHKVYLQNNIFISKIV